MIVVQDDTEQSTYVPNKRKRPTIRKKTKINQTKLERLKETSMRFLFLLAKRFIAGETLDEALPQVLAVKNKGFATTVDILGESVKSKKAAKDRADDYCALVDRLYREDLETNVSLKLTQLGLDVSTQLCYENVCRVLDRAAEVDGYVRIDMEGSAYIDRTLELVNRWHDGYSKVGTVIQTMLKRSPKDVEKLIKSGIGIRLCKGAYKESSEIAYKSKSDVDMQFVELASHLLSSGLYHGIATHDEKMINHVREYAVLHNIPKDAFEFQMLFGIRPKLQKQLIEDGWRLRVYLPYGKSWLAYTLRRLRERKENLWFVAKNLIRR
jgi:proline dehydrogenase